MERMTTPAPESIDAANPARFGRLAAFGLALALVLGLASCSGDSGNRGGQASGDRTLATSAGGETTAEIPPLFAVLEDEGRLVLGTAEGYSLYIFDGDGRNDSACLDSCALTFIPLAVPADPRVAGTNVDEKLVDQFVRADGVSQVTYAGRALYQFSADSEPGASLGEGSGGRWHHISPLGERVPQLR